MTLEGWEQRVFGALPSSSVQASWLSLHARALAEQGCTQSPEEPLAVDCGPHIGSDVETIVRARSTSRLVRFTLPPFFDQGIPDQPPGDATYGCLPFVNYERTDGAPTRKSINLNYLQFLPEECEFDP